MSRQQGVVLLSMLLILALLSALAYQIVGRHSLLVAQARYSFGQDQALAYAIGAETLARQVLYQDFTETGAGVDTFQEIWAQPLAPFEIEQGMVSQLDHWSWCSWGRPVNRARHSGIGGLWE